MTADPGVFAAPAERPARAPDLDALQERIGRAIATVEDLGHAHAATIAAKAAADARAKQWADLAYEMWSLLANSVHDGHGRPDAGARWQIQKMKLRSALFAMLDDRPEEPTP